MPDHVQNREEREFNSPTDVVALDLLDVDPEVWTRRHNESPAPLRRIRRSSAS
jgi:hypothetical protein